MKTLKNDWKNARENATKHFEFEPKMTHRWIIEIKEMDIKPYYFQTISAPAIIKKRSGWGYTKPHIEPIDFSLIESTKTNHYGSFIEKIRDNDSLTITIKYVDPTGKVISKLLLEKCSVIEIWQSELTYHKDNILNTFVKVKPLSVKFSL